MNENHEDGQGKKSAITVRKAVRLLSFLGIVFFFCPSFLVSCSGKDVNVSAMTAVGGVSMYGEEVAAPHPAMLACLLFPIVILGLLFIKKYSDKKTAVIIMACGSMDFVIWLIFRSAVKKIADENYCSFKTTGWYVCNILVLLLIILFSALVVLGKMKMETNLAAQFAASGARGALSQMSNAVTNLTEGVAGNVSGKKQKADTIGFCSKCGNPIAYGCRFCTACGMAVPDSMLAEAEAQRKAAENANGAKFCKGCGKPFGMADEARREKKTAAPKADAGESGGIIKAVPKKALVGILAAAVVLIVIVFVAVNSGSTINLDDYLTIEADGYNGYGTAKADIDWDAIEAKYGGKVSFTDKAKNEYGGFANLVTPAEAMQDYIRVKLDQSDGLSNGDEITYIWDVDEDFFKDIKCKIKYKDGAYSVSGLAEVETFDAFADLEVTFSGVGPDGNIELEYKGMELSESDFNCDKESGLSNGDIVTVSIDDSQLEYCAENFGRVPETMEKEYKVEGLSSYISAISELSAEELVSMQRQASDVYHAYAARDWSEGAELESFTYIGNYLLTNKDTEIYYGENNVLYLVYKVRARNTCSNGEESFDEVNDVYWYIAFDNLMAEADGSLTVDVDDYSTPRKSFTVDSGISSGWFSTYSWYYYGYETLDALYEDVVTSNMDAYNHEDNVDENASSAALDQDQNDSLETDYVFHDSNVKLLTEEDLEGLSAEECKIARNEIYARHGRKFNDQNLQAYFNARAWYEGTVEPDDFKESVLSDIENANKDLIDAYEVKKGYK